MTDTAAVRVDTCARAPVVLCVGGTRVRSIDGAYSEVDGQRAAAGELHPHPSGQPHAGFVAGAH